MPRKNPAVSLPPAAAQPDRARSGPLLSAYVMTLGGIGGIATGFALYGLRAIVFSVFPALFAAVGVDPLVRWFQCQRMSRTWHLLLSS